MNSKQNWTKGLALILAAGMMSGALNFTALAADSASSSASTSSSANSAGTPPSGTPPTGTPPAGTPPTGTPPAKPDGTAGQTSKTKSDYFSDVTSNYTWAISQIDYLVKNKIVTGTSSTKYSPASTITRGDFVLMLSRQFAFSAEGTEAYTDVPSTSYYYSAIVKAKAAGVLTSDEYFYPTKAITRQDAMTMLYKAMTASGTLTSSDASSDLSSYSDASSIDSSAAEAVATLSSKKIIQGSGGKFSPSKTMSRAEMAVVFYNVANLNNKGGAQGSAPSGTPGSGSSTGSIALTGANTADGTSKTSDNETITSTTANQSAVLAANSGSYTLTGATITKTGDTTSEEESNFYGVNSAVTAAGGSSVTISDSTITTGAEGANAIFATGDNSVIKVSDVTINTTGNSSRGLDATYNGTVTAENVTITTAGAHCAALATDRGEGTVTLTGGTLKTAGEGSPGIYSTGNITATDVVSTAAGSEAAVIEGKNSITVSNCTLSGAKNRGVMIYQSTSGDAGVGTGTFTMTDGSLTALEGPLFYITNTDAVIKLSGAALSCDSGTLLSASKDKWGTSGSNGGNVTLTADGQELKGNVICDSISTAALNLTNESTLSGAINSDNTAKSVALTLDSTSTWKVTGTSYITALTDADTDLSNIEDNGNTIYYDSTNSANSWLAGATITLSGGGLLTPAK